jgi:CheY-like chemotaxis protein
MRVLAAEDNPVFQSMLKTMLTKWGYQAIIARSGTEAWRVLESEDAPRLAVLDWMMPGMDGLEVTRKIKSNPALRAIVVVALTAYAMKGDEEKARAAGCDGYITKPIDTRKLVPRIRELLDKRSAGIDAYSARCLARIWKAERFSWWFTSLMHKFPETGAFGQKMQAAELDYLVASRLGVEAELAMLRELAGGAWDLATFAPEATKELKERCIKIYAS